MRKKTVEVAVGVMAAAARLLSPAGPAISSVGTVARGRENVAVMVRGPAGTPRGSALYENTTPMGWAAMVKVELAAVRFGLAAASSAPVTVATKTPSLPETMSVENVKAFFEKVAEDEALQEKLKAAREKRKAAVEAARAEVVSIASEAGFEFTPADLAQAREQATRELSMDELKAVAGGEQWCFVCKCGCQGSRSGRLKGKKPG